MKERMGLILLLTIVMSQTITAQTKGAMHLSHLSKKGNATQLIVDQKPFLLLGGELGNSSSSDVDYLRPIWPRLAQMHLNAVLAPVYWELVEPAEGQYDFTLVDSMIQSTRNYKMKLVFLWFGSWKNSMSCYAPLWVKTDQKRFPRCRSQSGQALEILTPFVAENMRADSRAFAALMRHIRLVDETEGTVIMIQVENEIGMIPDARDYSREANQRFDESVPLEWLSYLQKNKKTLQPQLAQKWEKMGCPAKGNWQSVFGEGLATDELFMAWYFARYTDQVTAAGKAEYPLPMYVNAALIRPGYRPGQYPSAGPLPHLLDVWRAGASHIDFLAPDIYFNNFAEWCAKYDQAGNPLLIPEVGNSQSAANAFFAFAQHNAMGYSPFSVESLDDPGNNQLSQAYRVLHQLTPLILANQGSGNIKGVLLDSTTHQSRFELGDYAFTVRHEYSWAYAQRKEGVMPRYGGLIIKLAADEFIIAGSGLIIQFAVRADQNAQAGIACIDEGRFIAGEWIPGRRLNGDQTHQGRHAQLPGQGFSILKVKLYTYK